jgi:cell division protein FtsQ
VSERQQNVTPRPKRAAAKPPRAAAPVARRRSLDLVRWVRLALAAALVALPVAGYYAAAGSQVFALKRVEVVGASRTSPSRVEQIVREAAGPRLLATDLDVVRRAVEAERSVRSASVVRVLPNTIRVRVDEREPVVVVRIDKRLAWAAADGHVLGDFSPENGDVPPPLAGFDSDPSERAAAENRDRLAAYAAVREALEPDGLWDRVDEVNIKYLQNVKVQLADSGLMVWLGNRDYRERMLRGLAAIDAARRGEVLVPENFGGVDASLENGKVNYFKRN